MKAKWFDEVAVILQSDEFHTWLGRLERSRKNLRLLRERHEELLTQVNLLEFRAEIAHRKAIDTLERANQLDDESIELSNESAEIENASFEEVSQFEAQRAKCTKLWESLGAVDMQIDEAKGGSDVARLNRQREKLAAEYEREAERKQELWVEVEALWVRSIDRSLALHEKRHKAKVVRSEAETYFQQQSSESRQGEALREEADKLAEQLAGAEAEVTTCCAEARENYECLLHDDFLYWSAREDNKLVYATPLLYDTTNYAVELRPGAVYQCPHQKGLDELVELELEDEEEAEEGEDETADGESENPSEGAEADNDESDPQSQADGLEAFGEGGGEFSVPLEERPTRLLNVNDSEPDQSSQDGTEETESDTADTDTEAASEEDASAEDSSETADADTSDESSAGETESSDASDGNEDADSSASSEENSSETESEKSEESKEEESAAPASDEDNSSDARAEDDDADESESTSSTSEDSAPEETSDEAGESSESDEESDTKEKSEASEDDSSDDASSDDNLEGDEVVAGTGEADSDTSDSEDGAEAAEDSGEVDSDTSDSEDESPDEESGEPTSAESDAGNDDEPDGATAKETGESREKSERNAGRSRKNRLRGGRRRGKRHRRTKLEIRTELVFSDKTISTTTQNIAAGGISFQWEERVEVGEKLEARCYIPLDDSFDPIKIQSEVVWVDPVGDDWKVGIAFREFAENDEDQLKKWLLERIRAEKASA